MYLYITCFGGNSYAHQLEVEESGELDSEDKFPCVTLVRAGVSAIVRSVGDSAYPRLECLKPQYYPRHLRSVGL